MGAVVHLLPVGQKNGQQIGKTVWWTAQYVHSILKAVPSDSRWLGEAVYLPHWCGFIPPRSIDYRKDLSGL